MYANQGIKIDGKKPPRLIPAVKDLEDMKPQNIIFMILLVTLSSCTSMVPYQNTDKLNATYDQTTAIDNSLLEVRDIISFKPGLTRFTFPIGSYKPVENRNGYVYFMSPCGTFVQTIGSSYYTEGGIKLNIETGDLKFISFLGALPVGKQNIGEYADKIVFSRKE